MTRVEKALNWLEKRDLPLWDAEYVIFRELPEDKLSIVYDDDGMRIVTCDSERFFAVLGLTDEEIEKFMHGYRVSREFRKVLGFDDEKENSMKDEKVLMRILMEGNHSRLECNADPEDNAEMAAIGGSLFYYFKFNPMLLDFIITLFAKYVNDPEFKKLADTHSVSSEDVSRIFGINVSDED